MIPCMGKNALTNSEFTKLQRRVLCAKYSPSRALQTGWQLSTGEGKSNCKPT